MRKLFIFMGYNNTEFLTKIQSVHDFNTKTKFNKIRSGLGTWYEHKKSCNIKIYYVNNFKITCDTIGGYPFLIIHSDEEEFNKFKKKNPELQHDTFDDILEIEKDYDNKEDFQSDFVSRIQNMINY
jgi:hypothetical protein